jgi:hypothetical protein
MILPEWLCGNFFPVYFRLNMGPFPAQIEWLHSWHKFNGERPLSELPQGDGNRPADCTWNC